MMDLVSLGVALLALAIGTYDWYRLRSLVRDIEQNDDPR